MSLNDTELCPIKLNKLDDYGSVAKYNLLIVFKKIPLLFINVLFALICFKKLIVPKFTTFYKLLETLNLDNIRICTTYSGACWPFPNDFVSLSNAKFFASIRVSIVFPHTVLSIVGNFLWNWGVYLPLNRVERNSKVSRSAYTFFRRLFYS